MAIDTIGLNKINTMIDLGPTQSIQLLFAKLQLAMAEQSKTQAMGYMDAITESQEKSKEVAAMIQQCRELQSQAKNEQGGGYVDKTTGETLTQEQYNAKYNELVAKYSPPRTIFSSWSAGADVGYSVCKLPYSSMGVMRAKEEMAAQYSKMDSDETAIPPEIRQFMADNGLALDKANGGLFFDKDGWEVNITSLRNYQEQLGADTQQKMVFIQDFMGQYNSYLQGANSAIQQSNQTLSTIARGQ